MEIIKEVVFESNLRGKAHEAFVSRLVKTDEGNFEEHFAFINILTKIIKPNLPERLFNLEWILENPETELSTDVVWEVKPLSNDEDNNEVARVLKSINESLEFAQTTCVADFVNAYPEPSAEVIAFVNEHI